MSKTPTIRSLARRLRLSVATVSEALRDSPRVRRATRTRVKAAALQAGYRVNPLIGAALSAVRRARHQHYRGTLALIDDDQENREHYILFHREIAKGAEQRARQLGFTTQLFWLGNRPPALTAKRLPGVLAARGISGAVLLPFNLARDLSDFDFSHLAAVQMDHCLIRPQLHTVIPDHYVSMRRALERLTALGYRRPGLCIEERKDVRVKHKWTAAFQSYSQHLPAMRRVPPLVAEQLTPDTFLGWYRRQRPDVIVGHVQAMVDWLGGIGCGVPTDVGFLNLNLTERSAPCAGLDLNPQRLGAVAVETVVAMLHRAEQGVPAFAQTITLEASWVNGPTLRAPAAAELARA